MTGPRVFLEGVVAGYPRSGRRVALRDVSLTADPGSVTAVVGPNGSGKSTLLGLMLGQGRAWTGRLTVGGVSPLRYRRAFGVGYLPEVTRLPRGWTLRELLAHGASMRACPDRAWISWYRRLELEDDLDRMAARLSKGTRRRAGLAWALTGDPGLVLLDEPASGLDVRGRGVLYDVVRELGSNGTTVVLVSHDPGLVRATADRVVALRAGRVTTDPPTLSPA